MDNAIGNSTTIGKFIIISFAGWILSLAAAKGLNLGIDAQTLAEVIGAVLGLAYAYIDAKYPNTFSWLGNAKNPVTDENITGDNNEGY